MFVRRKSRRKKTIPKRDVLAKMARRYYNIAFSAYSNNDFIRAIRFYSDYLNLKPFDATAWYNRGLAFANVNHPKRALTDFDRAIDLNPSYSDAFTNRGLVRERVGDKDAAFADFDKAISLAPNFVGAFFHRGRLYYERGEFDCALVDYTSAIENCVNQPQYRQQYNRQMHSKSLVARGVLFRKRGFLIKAEADYRESIRVDADFPDAYMGLANVLTLQGKFKEAVELNTTAIRLSIDDPRPFMNRGLAYIWLNNYQHAIDDFSTVIALDRKNVEQAYRFRAKAYRKLGMELLAKEDEQKAQKLKNVRTGNQSET